MLKRSFQLLSKYGLLLQALAVLLIALALTLLGHSDKQLKTAADWLLNIDAAIISFVLFWRLLDKVRMWSFNFDFVVIISIAAAIFIGFPWIAMLLATFVLILELVVKVLRNRGQSNLQTGGNINTMATVLRGRKTVETPVSKLKKNDKLYISPGEVVPVDCTVTQGESVFKVIDISGTTDQVKRSSGDELLSGMVNTEDPITARVLRDAPHSYQQLLSRLIGSADFSQSPFEKTAEKFALFFGLVLLAVAVVIGVISKQNDRFLQILLVISPLTLIGGLPLIILIGLRTSSKRHIIIKSASFMERIAELQTLAFDQPRIVTRGEPHVVAINAFKRSITQQEILGIAGSLMLHSTHQYANTITKEAYAKQAPISTVRGLTHDGQVVQGVIVRQNMMLGSYAGLMEHDVDLPKSAHNVERPTLFLSIDSRVVGSITIADEINPDFEVLLSTAKKYGIAHTMLLSEDTTKAAHALAQQLNISSAVAETDVAHRVRSLYELPHNQKPVAYVTADRTDATPLGAADVGIALGRDQLSAVLEYARVFILDNRLSKVSEAISLSNKVFGRGRLLVLYGVVSTLLLVVLAGLNILTPWYALGARAVADIVALLLLLRLNKY